MANDLNTGVLPSGAGVAGPTPSAAPAVISNLPFDEYVTIPLVHATLLKEMLRSPLHFKHRAERPIEDRASLRVGRAAHMALFEPELFYHGKGIAIWPSEGEEGKKQVRRGERWGEFKKLHQGRALLSETEHDAAVRLRDAVLSHPVARVYLAEPGRGELTVKWTHRSGIGIKCRFDWLCSVLVDLKTTATTSKRDFEAACVRYGVALQLALYADAATAIGAGPLPVKVIAVEKDGPADVAVFDVPPEILDFGRRQYERALERVAECTRKNEWPGAHPEEVPLALPDYAMNDEQTINEPDAESGFDWEAA